ncbi:MAG TPA: cytochrome c [Flavobacteriia bacterium]|jgi:cytochrome c1|nr:cytochrome c [Flavobacteriia bacterium]
MKTLRLTIIVSLLAGVFVFLYSCSSTENTVTKVKKDAIVHSRSGAQLWGENCIRCHNIPSPASYNDTDWSTIGLHMRVRANLTDEEAKKIFDFLKTAN